MDQLNILKTIALPDPITGENLNEVFDDVNANFNTLGSSTYTAGKDGITRVHTLVFKDGGVANKDSFENWLTTQIGIEDAEKFTTNIVNTFITFDDSNWYHNRSYEIYIGSDNKVKEALPILYSKDNVISYLGFVYDTNGTLKLERKSDVLSIDDKGYWVVNGISTQVKARGIDGKDGVNGSGLDFGVVTVISTEDEPNFLKIDEYWSGDDNKMVTFDGLTPQEKDVWFNDNKNKVFLFTYDEKPDNQEHPQTYMGYVAKIVTVNKEGTPSNTYGFYYSDNTIYSPGIGGSGDLITLLDNMSYTQSNSGKPRGIWFKSNKDDSAVFVYNDNNALNIGKIEDYSSAYKTNEITTKSTEVKINGSATISGTATLNGGAIIKNGTTINNSLTIGSTNTNQIVLSTATKNDSELGYYSGDKLIQIVGTRTIDDKQEYRVTTITPTKITSSDLKLIGGATINGATNLDGSLTIGSISAYNKELNLYGVLNCYGTSTDNRIGLYTASSNKDELGLIGGDKYIQVAGIRTIDNKQEYRVTTITPTKITSSDLKLIGGATINGSTTLGGGATINKGATINDGATINGTATLDGSLNIGSISANKNLNLYGTLNCFGTSMNNIIGLYTADNDDSTYGFVKGNKFIRVGDVGNETYTTITPAKITSTDLVLNGDATIKGVTNLNDTTIKGTTTLEDKLNFADYLTCSDNILNIDDLVIKVSNDNYFNYPKLIYEVLNKLEIIEESSNPWSLKKYNKIFQTNFCNLYIRSCESTKYHYNGTNVFSVSLNNNGLTGNLYKISGYIIFNDGSYINPGFSVSSISGPFNVSNIKISTPNIIYIDDYFAFVKNNGNDIIITPYGVKDGKFIPHYNFNSGTDFHNYNLNSLYSTVTQREGGNETKFSVAAQSVICDCGVGGENFAFNLIYDISNNQ